MSCHPASDDDHGHGDHHGHNDHHGHGHGHANDQGFRAVLRYLRWAPEMWRSEINTAVLGLVAPSPGELVMDIGAGMGPGTVLAAGAGASVVAVEPTPFMRRVLSVRRLLSRHRSRISIDDGAAEKLPGPDARFDAVWSVNAMHHWVDHERAGAEIARVLKPGGRLVLVDEDFTDPEHPDHERFGGGPTSTDDETDAAADHEHHGFTMVDAEHMRSLLQAVGLTDVDAATRRLAGRPVIAVTGRR